MKKIKQNKKTNSNNNVNSRILLTTKKKKATKKIRIFCEILRYIFFIYSRSRFLTNDISFKKNINMIINI